jgi:glycosyltransferase involved in cell wall biosynthesis
LKIWIDVEDLLQYAAHATRPSGIQRLAFELQQALMALAPDEVRLVRHARTGGFVSVSFSTVAEVFSGLTDRPSSEPQPETEGKNPHDLSGRPVRRFIRDSVSRLPLRQAALLRLFKFQLNQAFRTLLEFFRALPRPASLVPALMRALGAGATTQANPSSAAQQADSFAATVAAGDWLLALGSPWSAEGYADRIETAQKRYGIRFALLIHDIIAIRRTEWFDHDLTKNFVAWFDSTAPLAERLLAVSRATAQDVECYAGETGLRLQGPVQTIPLGTGFGQAPAPVRTARLPAPKSFALIVSTIEVRKNHLLLFRVWRRLLETMPAEQVPTLVFAGRIGWLVGDLMRQLKNAEWLGGKIRLIEGPSDGELATLYQDCLFTLFPSHYEGWGLPVTESLAHGAPCLAADRTSLPEAGGSLARYFDPDNLHDAVRVVRAAIEDRDGLEAWRAEIVREFSPRPWSESAVATLRLLRQPATPPVSAAKLPAKETAGSTGA